jgi:cytoskeletal protein CcmA (bactofilin family)
MKKNRKTDSISTFLGSDATFDGTLEFQGAIRLDGRVKGKIVSSDGTLIVGENAAVDAEIHVNVIIVMGEVNGLIEAKDRIEVYPPGRVGGEIHSPVVSIEPGGIFNGTCSMKPSSPAPGKPATSSQSATSAAEFKSK